MFYCDDDEKPRAPTCITYIVKRLALQSFFSQNCAVPSSGSSSYDLKPNFA